MTRLRPDQSDDAVIAAAGNVLWNSYQQNSVLPTKFNIDVGGSHYLHLSSPLVDSYGLSWVVSVVLSLTELFKDINAASMKMLGITAGTIIALSVIASLAITYAVVLYPLQKLSEAMEKVSEMNLENIPKTRSRLAEISKLQGFFYNMVEKLMV